MKYHKPCNKKLENLTKNMEEKSESKQIKPENSEKIAQENIIDRLENSQPSCSNQSKNVNHIKDQTYLKVSSKAL